MSAIGYVKGSIETGFKGDIRTLSIRRSIVMLLNRNKTNDSQPDFRIVTDDPERVELGAGWVRRGKQSGNDYVSVSLAAPEFGPRRIFGRLGTAAGQDDPDVCAIIWNPVD